MELIKRIKQAEAKAREIIEQAKPRQPNKPKGGGQPGLKRRKKPNNKGKKLSKLLSPQLKRKASPKLKILKRKPKSSVNSCAKRQPAESRRQQQR